MQGMNLMWSALGAAALLWTWLAIRQWRYRRSYPYSPAADHRYELPGAQRYNARVENGRIRFPQLPDDVGALLLALEVKATLPGRFFDPEVSLKLKSRSADHWLDRGCAGWRYLNATQLHKFLKAEASDVRLESLFASIPDQDAEIIVCKRHLRADDRIAVVAPHPDDAEIAAFGLYSSHSRSTWIVTLTNGENTLRYRHLADSDESASSLAGRLRATDPYACAMWAGLPPERIVLLGHHDSKLAEAYHSSPEGVGPVYGEGPPRSWPELVAALRRCFSENQISVVCAPHPLLDAHSDHVFAGLAVLEALLTGARLDVKLLLYTNHLPLSESYPLGPAGAAVSVPPAESSPPGCAAVLSHQLDPAMQAAKLLALEMNHALRDPPGKTGSGQIGGRSFLTALLGSNAYNHSYFRRAVRQNELFFLATGEELDRLYAATLVAVKKQGGIELASP